MKVHNKIGTKERFLEMFQNVNKMKVTESAMWGEEVKNENFDNPKSKDKEYLDNTVGDQTSQVSKYDDGTRYPVEDKLKVKDPSLEKMKGDDAPITEAFGEEDQDNIPDEINQDEPIRQDDPNVSDFGGKEVQEPVDGGEGEPEEKPAWDENFGGEEESEETEVEDPEMSLDNEQMTNTEELPHEDQIEGGLGDDASPNDFDSIQISKGIQIEMEHTDDPHKALEIAMDHLVEIPDYYDRLEAMEAEAKGESNIGDGNVESDMGAPEDALLDPSKHWVDDYAPQNVSMGDDTPEEIFPEEEEEEINVDLNQ